MLTYILVGQLLIHYAWAQARGVPHGGAPCLSNWYAHHTHMRITVSVSCVFPIRDCSLGGICDPSKRVCVCDAWFTNSTCNLLNLQPAVIGNGLDLRAHNYHSWYLQCSIEKNYLADSLPTIGEVIVFKILKIPIFIMVIFLSCATMKLSHPGPQHQVQILFYFIFTYVWLFFPFSQASYVLQLLNRKVLTLFKTWLFNPGHTMQSSPKILCQNYIWSSTLVMLRSVKNKRG